MSLYEIVDEELERLREKRDFFIKRSDRVSMMTTVGTEYQIEVLERVLDEYNKSLQG